jgi:3-oxoacyl-[acyl-carrier protein] reductase
MSRAVVVTGATRGVGRAVAEALAASGASLVVNGRNADALDALVGDVGSSADVVGVPGSVADPGVASALVDTCVERYGRIDALVNNAGIVRDRTTLRMSVAEFDDVVAVNLRGAWLCGRAAALAMKQTGGSIVNVVSEVAFYGAVGQSNYMASKAGLIALTTGWAQELARYGIAVNAVSPAALTEMSEVVLERARATAVADGRPAPGPRDLGIGDPAEIAPLITYLASDAARQVTGQVFSFNGRELGVWSFPAVAATATAQTWTEQAIGATLAGRLPLQKPSPGLAELVATNALADVAALEVSMKP